MYAVVRSGNKQYRVELGSELLLEKLDKQPGEAVELETLLVKTDDGLDLAVKAGVSATVIDHRKSRKVIVFKYKPKKRYKVMKGHRQQLTLVRVEQIGGVKLEEPKPKAVKKEAEEKPAKKSAKTAVKATAKATAKTAVKATAKTAAPAKKKEAAKAKKEPAAAGETEKKPRTSKKKAEEE